MSEHDHNALNISSKLGLPMIIAITALIISLTSGIVNYRQNNLSNLESSLRDTRDQLQLAKNDITDIRMDTLQQLMDAELAISNQSRLKHENTKLADKLKESNIRKRELEAQIRRMDHKLSRQASALRAAKKKANKPTAQKKPAKSFTPTASTATPAIKATNASANVDIYIKNMGPSLEYSIVNAIQNQGFKLKFPKLLESMAISSKTTVYYYDESYQDVANNLLKILKANSNGDVSLRKGVSPYAKNKIIVHLLGQ